MEYVKLFIEQNPVWCLVVSFILLIFALNLRTTGNDPKNPYYDFYERRKEREKEHDLNQNNNE